MFCVLFQKRESEFSNLRMREHVRMTKRDKSVQCLQLFPTCLETYERMKKIITFEDEVRFSTNERRTQGVNQKPY